MKKLKRTLLACSILGLSQAYAQDFIKKHNGEMLNVKVQDVNMNEVFYKTPDDPNGANKSIPKNDIAEIKYADGHNEYFGVQPTETSLEETKKFLTEEINAHASDPDNAKRHYQIMFEGDWVRLTVLDKKGAPTSDTHVYDFARAYKLSGTDRRSDELSYINMFVASLVSVKHNEWEKRKIVLRIDNDKRAESIFNAFKHYQYLVTKKQNGGAKF